MELRDVARVQPGYLSRTSVRSVPTGSHRLLQARDVSPQHSLRLDAAVRFNPERNPALYRVSRGDILLTARGQDHGACLVEIDLPDVLASSVFYIIRPREKLVLPGYLAWWLNQPDSQAALESASSGTGIGYIARPLMERIPVVVPSLDMQRKIAEAMDLWQRQQSIQARLDQKREELIHALCRRAVNGNKDNQVASEVGQAFLPDTAGAGHAGAVGQAFLPDTHVCTEKSGYVRHSCLTRGVTRRGQAGMPDLLGACSGQPGMADLLEPPRQSHDKE